MSRTADAQESTNPPRFDSQSNANLVPGAVLLRSPSLGDSLDLQWNPACPFQSFHTKTFCDPSCIRWKIKSCFGLYGCPCAYSRFGATLFALTRPGPCIKWFRTLQGDVDNGLCPARFRSLLDARDHARSHLVGAGGLAGWLTAEYLCNLDWLLIPRRNRHCTICGDSAQMYGLATSIIV